MSARLHDVSWTTIIAAPIFFLFSTISVIINIILVIAFVQSFSYLFFVSFFLFLLCLVVTFPHNNIDSKLSNYNRRLMMTFLSLLPANYDPLIKLSVSFIYGGAVGSTTCPLVHAIIAAQRRAGQQKQAAEEEAAAILLFEFLRLTLCRLDYLLSSLCCGWLWLVCVHLKGLFLVVVFFFTSLLPLW